MHSANHSKGGVPIKKIGSIIELKPVEVTKPGNPAIRMDRVSMNFAFAIQIKWRIFQ